MDELDGEVLVTYEEGRVVKLPDGTLVAEGIFDGPDVPMRGRFVVKTPPPPKHVPQPEYGHTIRGRPIVSYRERQPWETKPKAPNPHAGRIEDEERARALAYEALDTRRRPAEEQRPDPDPSLVVLGLARRNAEIVMAKYNQGVGR